MCTPPEVRYGALSEDELFKPGTTISGSCDTGYASITGGITGSCDVNYQATIVGTCKQRKWITILVLETEPSEHVLT